MVWISTFIKAEVVCRIARQTPVPRHSTHAIPAAQPRVIPPAARPCRPFGSVAGHRTV